MSCTNVECGKGFNIWTDIITPLIISPILLVLKILYDRISEKRKKSLDLKNTKKLDKISNKLQEFYWPLYIRLLKDYDLWSHFEIFNENFYDDVEHDTDSDSDIDESYRCSYKEEINLGNGNKKYIYCNIPVHRNCNFKDKLLCYKHRNEEKSDIVIKNHSKNNVIFKDITKDLSNIPDVTFSGNFTGNNAGEISGLTDSEKINKILLNENLKKAILNIIINNHSEIHDIIIKNISLGEPNSKMGQEIMKFMKFTTIVKCICNEEDNDPSLYDASYPKKLLPYIEKKVFKLQKQYNELIDVFYYK